MSFYIFYSLKQKKIALRIIALLHTFTHVRFYIYYITKLYIHSYIVLFCYIKLHTLTSILYTIAAQTSKYCFSWLIKI